MRPVIKIKHVSKRGLCSLEFDWEQNDMSSNPHYDVGEKSGLSANLKYVEATVVSFINTAIGASQILEVSAFSFFYPFNRIAKS